MTREPHVGAQVALAGETECAPAARNGRVEHDALAGAGAGGHDAGELVAEHERAVEQRVADAALEEPVPVGAAEADAAHAHEHLPPLRLGCGLFVQAQLACGVQPQRLHAGWP